MLLKLSEHMWRRHFLSGFPTLLILLSFPSHWQRAGGNCGRSDRCHQRSRAEYPDHPVPNLISSKLDSMLPLVGSTLPSAAWMGQTEETGWPHSQGATSWPRGRPPKTWPVKDGAGNSPPSSPERGCPDSDGYSTVSEAQSTCCHRRRWWGEKQLAPVHLDMPIFK